jgi:hypothetical protein
LVSRAPASLIATYQTIIRPQYRSQAACCFSGVHYSPWWVWTFRGGNSNGSDAILVPSGNPISASNPTGTTTSKPGNRPPFGFGDGNARGRGHAAGSKMGLAPPLIAPVHSSSQESSLRTHWRADPRGARIQIVSPPQSLGGPLHRNRANAHSTSDIAAGAHKTLDLLAAFLYTP